MILFRQTVARKVLIMNGGKEFLSAILQGSCIQFGIEMVMIAGEKMATKSATWFFHLRASLCMIAFSTCPLVKAQNSSLGPLLDCFCNCQDPF